MDLSSFSLHKPQPQSSVMKRTSLPFKQYVKVSTTWPKMEANNIILGRENLKVMSNMFQKQIALSIKDDTRKIFNKNTKKNKSLKSVGCGRA